MVNVQRRNNGNYEFRKRIPKQLHKHYGKREVVESLKTKDEITANRNAEPLRKRYEAEFKSLLLRIVHDENPKKKDLSESEYLFFDYGVRLRIESENIDLVVDKSKIEGFENYELGQLETFLDASLSDMEWVQEQSRYSKSVLKVCWFTLWDLSLLEICQKVSGNSLDNNELRIKTARRVIPLITQKIKSVKNDVAAIRSGYISKINDEETTGVAESNGTSVSRSDTNPLFSEVAEKYLDKENLKENSTHALKEGVSLFIEWAGDKPVLAYSVDELVDYRNNCLRKLPKNRNKKNAYKGKTLKQSIKSGAADEHIGSTRIDTLISKVHTVFEHAKKRQWINHNPASDLKEPKQKTSRAPDKSYTDDELQKLFHALKYESEAPSHYWVVMIALFNSLRAREVSQLHINDILDEAGILCFDINENDAAITKKSVKNHSSCRIVPVHPDLVDAGFMQFVDQRKSELENQNGLLFSDVVYSGRSGYAEAVGRWFNRTLKPKFMSSDNTTNNGLHSLRNTFGRYAKNRAKMDADARKVLMGHSSEKGSEVHDGYTVEEIQFLYDELKKLDYGLKIPPNPFMCDNS